LNPTQLEALNSKLQTVFYELFHENISSFVSKWVKIDFLFKNLRLKETKLNLTKDKNSKSKKEKGSKKEPNKKQEKAKKKRNLFVVFVFLERAKKKQK
jgi:hypothetical protein